VARARAELDPGRVEVAVDRLRGDTEAGGDLLAAVAVDDVTQAVPLTVTEEIGLYSRIVSPFSHRRSVAAAMDTANRIRPSLMTRTATPAPQP
jgi:hypothetical protein